MGVPKCPWNMARVWTLRDEELAGRGADGADGSGGTARQRMRPGRQLGGRRWVPVRAKRGRTVCGWPPPPRSLGGIRARGCDCPQGRLEPVPLATCPQGGRGSEKPWEQQGP